MKLISCYSYSSCNNWSEWTFCRRRVNVLLLSRYTQAKCCRFCGSIKFSWQLMLDVFHPIREYRNTLILSETYSCVILNHWYNHHFWTGDTSRNESITHSNCWDDIIVRLRAAFNEWPHTDWICAESVRNRWKHRSKPYIRSQYYWGEGSTYLRTSESYNSTNFSFRLRRELPILEYPFPNTE